MEPPDGYEITQSLSKMKINAINDTLNTTNNPEEEQMDLRKLKVTQGSTFAHDTNRNEFDLPQIDSSSLGWNSQIPAHATPNFKQVAQYAPGLLSSGMVQYN